MSRIIDLLTIETTPFQLLGMLKPFENHLTQDDREERLAEFKYVLRNAVERLGNAQWSTEEDKIMRSFPRAEWKEFYAATHKLFTKFVGVSPHDALMPRFRLAQHDGIEYSFIAILALFARLNQLLCSRFYNKSNYSVEQYVAFMRYTNWDEMSRALKAGIALCWSDSEDQRAALEELTALVSWAEAENLSCEQVWYALEADHDKVEAQKAHRRPAHLRCEVISIHLFSHLQTRRATASFPTFGVPEINIELDRLAQAVCSTTYSTENDFNFEQFTDFEEHKGWKTLSRYLHDGIARYWGHYGAQSDHSKQQACLRELASLTNQAKRGKWNRLNVWSTLMTSYRDAEDNINHSVYPNIMQALLSPQDTTGSRAPAFPTFEDAQDFRSSHFARPTSPLNPYARQNRSSAGNTSRRQRARSRSPSRYSFGHRSSPDISLRKQRIYHYAF